MGHVDGAKQRAGDSVPSVLKESRSPVVKGLLVWRGWEAVLPARGQFRLRRRRWFWRGAV